MRRGAMTFSLLVFSCCIGWAQQANSVGAGDVFNSNSGTSGATFSSTAEGGAHVRCFDHALCDEQGALILQAGVLWRQASDCYEPVFSRWTKDSGNFVASARAGDAGGTPPASPASWVVAQENGTPPSSPTAPTPNPNAGPQRFATVCPGLVAQAQATASAIAGGSTNPSIMIDLTKTLQSCPPSFPRPYQCFRMMVDAQSKVRSNPDYSGQKALQAKACYENYNAADVH